MGLLSWVDSRIKDCRWFDISLIKLSAAAFVLMIGKLWPPLLSLEWYWYLFISIVVALPVLGKMCRK